MDDACKKWFLKLAQRAKTLEDNKRDALKQTRFRHVPNDSVFKAQKALKRCLKSMPSKCLALICESCNESNTVEEQACIDMLTQLDNLAEHIEKLLYRSNEK